jgi:hypothetical protein
MAVYSPTWSYGQTKLINVSSDTVIDGDIDWSYGQSILFMEYIAGGGTIPIIKKLMFLKRAI